MITWGQSRKDGKTVNNVFCTICREFLGHDVDVVDAMIIRDEGKHDCPKQETAV